MRARPGLSAILLGLCLIAGVFTPAFADDGSLEVLPVAPDRTESQQRLDDRLARHLSTTLYAQGHDSLPRDPDLDQHARDIVHYFAQNNCIDPPGQFDLCRAAVTEVPAPGPPLWNGGRILQGHLADFDTPQLDVEEIDGLLDDALPPLSARIRDDLESLDGSADVVGVAAQYGGYVGPVESWTGAVSHLHVIYVAVYLRQYVQVVPGGELPDAGDDIAPPFVPPPGEPSTYGPDDYRAWTERLYTDVPLDAHYHDELERLTGNGIAGGHPDGTFRPDEAVQRQQMATFIMRTLAHVGSMLESVDVPYTDTISEAHVASVAALTGAEIASGYEDNTFRAATPVTRAQMASFLDRSATHHLGRHLPNGDHGFYDVRPGNVHAAAIGRLAHNGIAQGTASDTFVPDQLVTRAQMVLFLDRWLDAVTNFDQAASSHDATR